MTAAKRLGGTVLVVDDDETVRHVVQLIAARLFDEVVSAKDGGQAQALLTSRTFDAVVSDLRMPTASGIDLLRFVRERGAATPFLIISGLAEEEDEHEIAELDGRLLRKPFGAEQLSRAIVACVEGLEQPR